MYEFIVRHVRTFNLVDILDILFCIMKYKTWFKHTYQYNIYNLILRPVSIYTEDFISRTIKGDNCPLKLGLIMSFFIYLILEFCLRFLFHFNTLFFGWRSSKFFFFLKKKNRYTSTNILIPPLMLCKSCYKIT